MTTLPKFNTTKTEHKLIQAIVKRAKSLDVDDLDPFSLEMDITACHCNGCPLRLDALLDAKKGDFGHDVLGIRRFMDRSTGALGGFFTPRFAQPQ